MGLSLPPLADLQGPMAALWRKVYAQAAQVAARQTEQRVDYHVHTYHPGGLQDYLTQAEGDVRYSPIGALINPMTSTGDLIVGLGSEANWALVARGAVATTGGYGGGGGTDPGNAIDDDDATYATLVNAFYEDWVQVDLGVERTVGSYRLRHRTTRVTGGSAITWVLESSVAGSTWTARATGTIPADHSWLDTGAVALAAPLTVRYWRYRLPPDQDSLTDVYLASFELLGAGAVGDPPPLGVGTNGPAFPGDSTAPDGLRWGTATGGGLATDPLADVKGDVFAASGNNAIGRLALGTDGQVLTADAAQTLGGKWATPGRGGSGAGAGFRGAFVSRTTALPVADNAHAAVAFDSETYDTDGFHSTSTNTTRLTVPAGLDGYYLVGGGAQWAPDAQGQYAILKLRKNGGRPHAA